jgi:gliding motility-associated protein GldE
VRGGSGILSVLEKLFYPLSSLLVRSKVFTDRLSRHSVEALTVDDLEKAMQLTDTQDIAAESKMLKSIIRFGGEMCKEVMTPRVDMVDIEFKTPFPKVLECIVENNYSRIPVYQGTEDHIKGVLYIKDLLPHLTKPANFRWQSLIRSAFFVPETKMIDDLLRDFQENKVHMAIVVDEFGGTSGLVTMEDIIEEIVGEIHDETDDEEEDYHRLNKNTWVFEGRTQLIDFYKVMQIDEDFFEEVEGEADTLAGLILELKGDFPELHERLTYKQFTFEVMEMDQRRIVSVKVIRGKK